MNKLEEQRKTMNKLEELVTLYPDVFRNPEPGTEDARYAYPSFGFECNDGWFNLLKEFAENTQQYFKDDPTLFIHQVKEKFGGIRIYLNEYLEEVEKFIREAEVKSFKTCEICGEPGVLREGGWIKTLCDEHSDGKKPLSRKMKSL